MSQAPAEVDGEATDPYQPPRADLGAHAGPEPLLAFPRGDKRWPWLMLILVNTILPFVEELVLRQHLQASRGGSAIDVLLFIIATYWWYVVDRRERGFPSGAWQNMGIFLFSLIGMPIYLFRSRGWLRGLIATIVSISAVIVFSVLSYFSEQLAVHVLR